jgi:hypothetical protein
MAWPAGNHRPAGPDACPVAPIRPIPAPAATVSLYHVRLREMSIEGADLMTVIDDDRPAVAATPSDEGDGAARRRANKCAPAGADVYAGVKSRPGCAVGVSARDGRLVPGGDSIAEAATHRTAPGQLTRPHGREKTLAALRFRWPVYGPISSDFDAPRASAPKTMITVTGITDHTAKQSIFS